MDIFKSTLNGKENLDDLTIYPDKWKEMATYELFSKCWEEAGKSIFHMKYLRENVGGEQWFRVDQFCKELVELRESSFKDTEENRLKFIKWLYKFKDEVENQC
ncbi:MAG: hypothetical protein ACOCP8_07510 [archaeon]